MGDRGEQTEQPERPELVDRLKEVAEQLRSKKAVPPLPLRELLAWMYAKRRGSWVNFYIRNCLKEAGLKTEPDFESAYIGSDIKFVLAPDKATEGAVSADVAVSVAVAVPVAGMPAAYADPTSRISKLAAANAKPISIPPDASLRQATTVMLANDFSQLPVMTNERDVKGVISWTSIGTRLVLERVGACVRDFMDSHQEIRADSSLFQAIPTIVQNNYVLVRGLDNRVTGIVTASDLSLQFQQLAEPFLLLGEIENHIRRILGDKFAPDELASVCDDSDGGRKVTRVDDLTFGAYIRLLENGERWKKINVPIDRVTFCSYLDQVRLIRNDVMHFDPDGIDPDDLARLRDFAQFLQRLQAVGVS